MVAYPSNFRGVALLPAQYDFVMAEQSEVMFSGAFGCGKTRALCYRAMRLAQRNPGARVGLTRVTGTSLRQTTLRTLLEPDGDLPPVLLPELYTYRARPGEERVTLHTGGEILPFACDQETRIGSMQLSDCCIDEAIELDEREWNMLVGRCRVTFTLPDGRQSRCSIATATNPGPPSHFLYRKFFEEPNDGSRLVIQTKTVDNSYLPADYIAALQRNFSGPALERYFHGQWCVYEGAVYPMFSVGVHVRHREGPWQRFVAGVDYGYVNPMALRVHAVDDDNRSHVVSEYHEAGVTTDQFVAICVQAAETYNPMVFVVDPSAAELRAKMRVAGLTVVKADNDVLAGIAQVQNSLMVEESTGDPRLTMEPSCRVGNTEYLNYRWKETGAKDEVVKKDDHACDADRYAIMHIRRGRRLTEFRFLGEPAGRPLTGYSESQGFVEYGERGGDTAWGDMGSVDDAILAVSRGWGG